MDARIEQPETVWPNSVRQLRWPASGIEYSYPQSGYVKPDRLKLWLKSAFGAANSESAVSLDFRHHHKLDFLERSSSRFHAGRGYLFGRCQTRPARRSSCNAYIFGDAANILDRVWLTFALRHSSLMRGFTSRHLASQPR